MFAARSRLFSHIPTLDNDGAKHYIRQRLSLAQGAASHPMMLKNGWTMCDWSGDVGEGSRTMMCMDPTDRTA